MNLEQIGTILISLLLWAVTIYNLKSYVLSGHVYLKESFVEGNVAFAALFFLVGSSLLITYWIAKKRS